MHHKSIDHYAPLSPFARLDPRTKIIAVLTLVVVTAFLVNVETVSAAALVALTLVLISGVPIKHTSKRWILTLPFSVFPALAILFFTSQEAALAMFLRINSCVLLLIFLTTTTPFFELLKGLQDLGFPKVMVVLVMFMYRYVYVLVGESERMRRARKARGLRKPKTLLDSVGMSTLSSSIGMVLVRSYNRGQRVYDALANRGWRGEIRVLRKYKVRWYDGGFASALVCIGAFLGLAELGVIS